MDFEEMKRLLDEDIVKYENGMDSAIGSVIKKMEIRDAQTERVKEFIYSLTKQEIPLYMNQLIEWETKYEDRWYDKGIQTTSLLFDAVTFAIEEMGMHVTPLNGYDEDFLTEVFMFAGYKFKLYQGQGSFWRIEKDDEIIFQSN